MLKIVVFGQPMVKKNNQHISWRSHYPIKYNTKAYTKWHQDALRQIASIAANLDEPISYPVNAACKFFMNTARKVDLSNLYEGIMDTLVEAGILRDDNYTIVVSHDGSGVFIDRGDPRIELELTPRV